MESKAKKYLDEASDTLGGNWSSVYDTDADAYREGCGRLKAMIIVSTGGRIGVHRVPTDLGEPIDFVSDHRGNRVPCFQGDC